VVAELVVGVGEDEDRFGASPELRDVDGGDGVTRDDLVEAEPGQDVVEIVDGRDGRQLPLKLVENEQLPFLEYKKQKNQF